MVSQKLVRLLVRFGVPISTIAGVLGVSGYANATAGDPFDLAGKIDTVASTTGNYFGIMISNFWPFALGGLILLAVIAFAYFIIHRFFVH